MLVPITVGWVFVFLNFDFDQIIENLNFPFYQRPTKFIAITGAFGTFDS